MHSEDIIDHKGKETIPRRTIPLSEPDSEPYALALSCDHSVLLVCFASNQSSFISISVSSFLSNGHLFISSCIGIFFAFFQNVATILQNVCVSPENDVHVTQILRNPIMVNTFAICFSNGLLSVIVLEVNSRTRYNFKALSIDKATNVRCKSKVFIGILDRNNMENKLTLSEFFLFIFSCASWSPNGKQIIVGLPGGKLGQYDQNLQLTKIISCAKQLPHPL